MERTGFEDRTDLEVVQSAIYTSEEMFGDIRFAAERELLKRLKKIIPVPDWYANHPNRLKEKGR